MQLRMVRNWDKCKGRSCRRYEGADMVRGMGQSGPHVGAAVHVDDLAVDIGLLGQAQEFHG